MWAPHPCEADMDFEQVYGYKQEKAAGNVKCVIAIFLIFDLVSACSFVYQYQHPAIPHADQTLGGFLAFGLLSVVLAIAFTIDAVLAIVFLKYLHPTDPKWEKYASLVNITLFANTITFGILAVQRILVVLSQPNMFLGVAALLYLLVRGVKLIPVLRLTLAVRDIQRDYQCVPMTAVKDRYSNLWDYWCGDSEWACLVKLIWPIVLFGLVSLVGIIAVFIYLSFHSHNTSVIAKKMPKDFPLPHDGDHQVTMQGTPPQPAQAAFPRRLGQGNCDVNNCYVNGYWYVCADEQTCKPHHGATSDTLVAKSLHFEAGWGVVNVGGGAAAGAVTGAAGSSFLGPEAVPFGATIGFIVGALGGTGHYAYQIESDYWCYDPHFGQVPQHAKNNLWCARDA